MRPRSIDLGKLNLQVNPAGHLFPSMRPRSIDLGKSPSPNIFNFQTPADAFASASRQPPESQA